jgi:6-pyruvoyltetrahydropterin/6-carboxytetrahydropterin synthase
LKYTLSQSFTFEAAHTLKRSVPVDEYTASARVHGHSYRATVAITGQIGAAGMLQVREPGKRIKFRNIDLFYLREAIERVRTRLDHQMLDDVPGLPAGTLECLCKFIVDEITLPIDWVSVERPSTGDACRLVAE